MRMLLASLCLSLANAATAEVCEGRYAPATSLIERAYETYGTLYSGGQDYGSVGPTLEIYRMLRGLPDAGMAEPQNAALTYRDPPGNISDPAHLEATLTRTLLRVHGAWHRRDGPYYRTDTEILLNNLTAIGPFPGWWLTPDAPHLTPVERIIASFAGDDALDWLLTTQAASARPHTILWRLEWAFRDGRAKASAGLVWHSLDRYAETESLHWLIAVQLVRESSRRRTNLTRDQVATLAAIDARIVDLGASVAACGASNAEYLAFSIATYEDMRRVIGGSYRPEPIPDGAYLMPPILRHLAAVQIAKGDLAATYGFRPDRDFGDVVALADAPGFEEWLNVGRSYRANSLADLVAVNAGVPLRLETMRFLNILSSDDLLTFARSRDAFPEEQRDLTTAVFLRLFALGRDAEAAALLEEVIALWPERDAWLRAAWRRPGDVGYRLAQVALSLPTSAEMVLGNRWSVYSYPAQQDNEPEDATDARLRRDFWSVARITRDMSLQIRTGGFLVRDWRDWLSTVGADENQWRSWDTRRRAYRRGQTLPDVLQGAHWPVPLRTSGGFHDETGPAGFAGWDELARLGPDTGLSNRIGRELIANARARVASGVWWRLTSDPERLAREMALVIRQARYTITGEMEGRPIGQVAFEILHGPLRATKAAQATPYWYVCRERCTR